MCAVAGKMQGQARVQNRDWRLRPPALNWPYPENFVWRLHGGRRSISQISIHGGNMTTDVVAQSPSTFDPWSSSRNDCCNGCEKIRQLETGKAASDTGAGAGAGGPNKDGPHSPQCKDIRPSPMAWFIWKLHLPSFPV